MSRIPVAHGPYLGGHLAAPYPSTGLAAVRCNICASYTDLKLIGDIFECGQCRHASTRTRTDRAALRYANLTLPL